MAATGTSQLALWRALREEPDIDWTRVELFHLDEYIGLSPTHPASFCRFIRERVVEPLGIRRVHLLDGTRDPADVVRMAGDELRHAPVTLTFCGIGENGHLAFNEPPADFDTDAPFLVVDLDEVSKRQQVNEGWFRAIADVPTRAITMSIPEILRSEAIVCVATEARKAAAVAACFNDGVRPDAPASALQTHSRAAVYLDNAAAAALTVDAVQRHREPQP